MANKCAIYGDRTEWIRGADEALATGALREEDFHGRLARI